MNKVDVLDIIPMLSNFLIHIAKNAMRLIVWREGKNYAMM